jgi:hypothetical protein
MNMAAQVGMGSKTCRIDRLAIPSFTKPAKLILLVAFIGLFALA